MSDPSARTPLSELLASITPSGDGYRVDIPADWLQGRAAYGGLSAALCLHAALTHFDDLPPLRSAQLTFIGPAGGTVEIQPTIARRGKSTTFVTVDLLGDDRLAVRAAFCFGAARESRLSDIKLPAPDVPSPDACGGFFEGPDGVHRGPNFARHFNARRAAGAMPMSAAQQPDFTVWMQHKDAQIQPLIVGLVALADALPPAAMACFSAPAPVSTINWMFDVLTDVPDTEDGWWLSRSSADATSDGYSSQAMTVWNRTGEPVLTGRQNVAIFF